VHDDSKEWSRLHASVAGLGLAEPEPEEFGMLGNGWADLGEPRNNSLRAVRRDTLRPANYTLGTLGSSCQEALMKIVDSACAFTAIAVLGIGAELGCGPPPKQAPVVRKNDHHPRVRRLDSRRFGVRRPRHLSPLDPLWRTLQRS